MNNQAPLFRLDAQDMKKIEQARAVQEELGIGLFHPNVLSALPKKWQLYEQQPPGMPDHYPGPLFYLIDNPDALASTGRWRRFREGMAELASARPEDPNFQAILRAVDDLLEWRSAIDPEDQFWKPDA